MYTFAFIAFVLFLVFGVFRPCTRPKELRQRPDASAAWKAAGVTDPTRERLIDLVGEECTVSPSVRSRILPSDTLAGILKMTYPWGSVDGLEVVFFMLEVEEATGLELPEDACERPLVYFAELLERAEPS